MTLSAKHKIAMRSYETAKTAVRQTANSYQLLRSRLIESAYTDLRPIIMNAIEANPLLEMDESCDIMSGEERAAGLVEDPGTSAAVDISVLAHEARSSSAPPLRDMRDFAAIQAEPVDYRIDLRLLVAQLLPSNEQREIAETLIDQLDERGYFAGNESAVALKHACSVEEVNAVLERIQTSLGNGIGAKDAVEAICLQIPDPQDRALLHTILSDHLADVQAGRLSKIARSVGATKGRVADALRLLSDIDMTAIRAIGADSTHYIRPDIIAQYAHGRLDIRVEGPGREQLRVSKYAELLEGDSLSAEDRTYIESRVREADSFIEALKARNTLLERFALVLAEREKGFLTTLDAPPEPLNMEAIAEELGVSISTVSRLCKNKYIRTNRGTLPLSFFFMKSFVTLETASGQQALQGKDISSIVASLIEGEDPSSPLSDEKIASEIHEKTGIVLARRTVAKHRKGLGIPNSSVRRQRNLG